MFGDDSDFGSSSDAVSRIVSVTTEICGGDTGASGCWSKDTSVENCGARRSATGETGASAGGDTSESVPGDSGAGDSRITESGDSTIADTGMSKSGA